MKEKILEMQDVYDYLAKGLKPMEFMKTCKKYSEYFIGYFEVIISKNGTTYFAAPSHAEKLKELVKKEHNVDFNIAPFRYGFSNTLLSAFGYASVHYNQVQAGNYLTAAQKRALKMYYRAGLISNTAIVSYDFDYQKYMIAESFEKDENYELISEAYNVFQNATEPIYESIYDAIYNDNRSDLHMACNKKVSVFDVDTDDVYSKYSKSMNPTVSDFDKYFTVNYVNIEKLPKYIHGAEYSIKRECFVYIHTENYTYPKSIYYYKTE